MFDKQKSDEFELTPELAAFRRQLRDFAPTPPRIDRDQLMFNAGRASALTSASRVVLDPETATPNSRHFWPATTATMTAATILLSAMLILDRASQRVAETRGATYSNAVTSTTVPDEPLDNQPWSPHATRGYLGLRNVALTRGIGAAATEFSGSSAPSDIPPTAPATTRQLFRELLPEADQQRS